MIKDLIAALRKGKAAQAGKDKGAQASFAPA